MKQVIIVHGMPSREEYFGPEGVNQSHKHWLGWIGERLKEQGYVVLWLEMPEPYEPVYEKWKSVFERYVIDPETILIGHSCGAGFLVRWLSENDVRVSKVTLVAPWLDPNRKLSNRFFDFGIDKDLVARTKGVTVFVSQDDEPEILDSVTKLKNSIPGIAVQEFSDRGHFTFGDMGTREFPELYKVLVDD